MRLISKGLRALLNRNHTPVAAPVEQEGLFNARGVGLRDAVMSGWYLQASDELFKGFRISRDDVVLDVGCGDGGNAHFCAMRGAHIIFADVDPIQVEATRRRLAETPARGLTPIVGDSNPLPLSDGAASKIIASEVMEHVDDPGQFLQELVRVGRSGAQYLLTVPDPVAETLQHDLAPATFFAKPPNPAFTISGLCPGHIRTFQRDEFAKLVESAGLVVEQHAFYGFYWAIWFALFWTCGVDFSAAQHPVLDNWGRAWDALLDTPGGLQVKRRLDQFMPKSQLIIARKP
ncbi:MAG TPA: class I SAM-dependent methyltransferase [Alphaproteobacteria bacterium]|nr:class I SAM-dependent methyltransferase [Alphaproteobacteria bacterium]